MVDDPCRNRRGGLNRVLPAVCIQNSMFLPDRYGTCGKDRFLTYFSGDLGFAQGLPFCKEADIQAAAKYTAIYKKYRHYLTGDYYHLLPMPTGRNAWDGWQYHDPKDQSGILLIFRLGESKQEEMTVRPRAVDDLGRYTWSVIRRRGRSGHRRRAVGADAGVGSSLDLLPDRRR